jgi:hypothetical protein
MKGQPVDARQIRGVFSRQGLAGPRQFQTRKNLSDFEFGQLFLSNRRAYD